MAFTLVRPEEAVVDARTVYDGSFSTTLRYFGRRAGRDPVPEANVIQLHNRRINTHFHPVDQFQIFLGAPGAKYQHQEVNGIAVHWADAYATYGPLEGGDSPFRFFTLRTELSDFTGFMPGSRDKLEWRGRRRHHVEIEKLDASDIPPKGSIRKQTIVERDEDGLEAFAIVAGPNTTFTLPDTEGTSGQYVLVVNGSLEYGEIVFEVESLGWLGENEDVVDVVSESEGCRILVLRFPSPTTVAQHKQAEMSLKA